MDSRQQITSEARITQEAADWLVELKGAGAATQAAFFEWLRRSPEHVREFLAVTGYSHRLQRSIDPEHRIDVQALLSDAGAEVVKLPLINDGPHTTRPRAQQHWKWGMAAAVGAVAIASALWIATRPDSYATRVGEQRSFSLSDGSLIYLNTHSRATVHYSGTAREIRLLQGEALFSVESDPRRPFRVKAGAATVQALGTQFNVYRHGDAQVTVSVLEGAVELRSDSAARHLTAPGANKARLDAGEQASLDPGHGIVKQTLADAGNVLAWRDRQLVFSKTPLSEVAIQFNRYNRVQIQVDESATQERQITGVFEADRPESLILFLGRDEALEIQRSGSGYKITPVNNQGD